MGARVGRHMEGGFANGGPTGIVGPGKNLGAVTQMRYRAPIFNHGEFQNLLRVGLCPTRSLPLQVTWTHDGRWIQSARRKSRHVSVRAAANENGNTLSRLIRQKGLSPV